MSLVPPTIRILADFYNNIRPEDLEECLVSDGISPLDYPSVDLLCKAGTMAVMYDNTECLGLCGVSNGCIWMLMTTHVYKHKIQFLRYSKEVVKNIRKSIKYPVVNKVWKQNKLHIDWLKWVGAELTPYDDNFELLVFYPL